VNALAHHGLQVDPHAAANRVRLALQTSDPNCAGQAWLQGLIDQINAVLDRLEDR
jgi:hypothetical protein